MLGLDDSQSLLENLSNQLKRKETEYLEPSKKSKPSPLSLDFTFSPETTTLDSTIVSEKEPEKLVDYGRLAIDEDVPSIASPNLTKEETETLRLQAMALVARLDNPKKLKAIIALLE